MSPLVLLDLCVREDLSYDQYLQQTKSIYRLNEHLAWAKNLFQLSVGSARMGPTLQQEFVKFGDLTGKGLLRVHPIALGIDA